jgi:AcrR family transcriptional regulator
MSRKKDTAVREGILRSAIQVFGELGFQSTTIKAIADRQGISPGTVYVYFSSKEELFRQAVEEGWAEFLAEIRRIVGAPRRLRERFETILDYCFDSLQTALPLLRGMLFDSRRRHLLQENLEKLVDLLEGLAGEVGTQIPDSEWLDPRLRRFQIRTTVLGVLTSVALAQDEGLSQEIATFKDLIKGLQYTRFAPGGQP